MDVQLTQDTDMTSDINVPDTNGDEADILGMKPNTFCMLLHLSQLLNYTTAGAPFLGLVIPIILWAIAKDKSTLVDQHGKNVLNWQITYLICFTVSVSLIIVFVGFLLVPVVIILGIAFPIIGAVKANEGTMWKYPLSIPFFK